MMCKEQTVSVKKSVFNISECYRRIMMSSMKKDESETFSSKTPILRLVSDDAPLIFTVALCQE